MADRQMKIDRNAIKDRYTTTTIEGADGKKRRVTDNGDEVAVMMRDVTGLDQIREFARKHGLEDRLNEKWSHLNAGQQRMAVGNALRHKLKKDREQPKAAA